MCKKMCKCRSLGHLFSTDFRSCSMRAIKSVQIDGPRVAVGVRDSWRLADNGVVDEASLIAANECADYVGRERLSIPRKHPVGYFSRQSECAAGPRNRAFRAAHPACAGCRMR